MSVFTKIHSFTVMVHESIQTKNIETNEVGYYISATVMNATDPNDFNSCEHGLAYINFKGDERHTEKDISKCIKYALDSLLEKLYP